MKIDRRETNGTDLFRVQDEVTLAHAGLLGGHMTALCGGADKAVRLDLSGISRIDTCGVAVLLACYRRIRSAGGTLTLCAAPETVRVMFSVCNVSDLLHSGDGECPPEKPGNA